MLESTVYFCYNILVRGISSVGRALHWQCRGQRFESAMLHQNAPEANLQFASGAFYFLAEHSGRLKRLVRARRQKPPSPAEAPPEGWKRQYRFVISAMPFCVAGHSGRLKRRSYAIDLRKQSLFRALLLTDFGNAFLTSLFCIYLYENI